MRSEAEPEGLESRRGLLLSSWESICGRLALRWALRLELADMSKQAEETMLKRRFLQTPPKSDARARNLDVPRVKQS